jgi:hypothetical protein
MTQIKDLAAMMLGSKGGKKTSKLYGKEHYLKMQIKSIEARRKNIRAKKEKV